MQTNDFYQKMVATIAAEQLIRPGDKVLAGVSGGADSMALIHCLKLFAAFCPISLGAAHLNHALRPKAADRDRAFTEKQMIKLNIPFYHQTINVPKYRDENNLSTEEAARNIRYDFFRHVAEKHGYTTIATAHHADDNAELIVMNLIRGSGLQGLTGIPVKRPMAFARPDGLTIIRPLLAHRKQEILSWLEAESLPFVTDASNEDMAFSRNRIRKQIMPVIAELSGDKAADIISRTGRLLRDENHWLADMANQLFATVQIAVAPRRVTLSTHAFNGLDRAAGRRVLRIALAHVKSDLRQIGYHHVESVIDRLAQTDAASFSLDLPDRIRVIKDRDAFYVQKELVPLRHVNQPAEKPQFYYSHDVFADSVTQVVIREIQATMQFSVVTDISVVYEKNTACLDFDKLSSPLVIRNPLPGDRFNPYGCQGSQKLKKFFANNKISGIVKWRCPLVVSNNDIAWVAGHRISDKFKITDQTRRVLKIELFLA